MLKKIDPILNTAFLQGRGVLYEFEIYEILKILGIETPHYVFAADWEEAARLPADGFGRDLVLKIVSPGIAHKQKLGGVKIIENWRQKPLAEIAAQMRAEVLSHFAGDKQPPITGFLFSELVPFTPSLGSEIMIGFREDEEFGSILLASKGGSDAEFFAEHYDPAAIVLPPLDYSQSLAFVETLKLTRRLQGLQRARYSASLADALTKISRLADYYSLFSAHNQKYRILSFDINPLVFTPQQKLVAVDGYAEIAPASAERRRLPTADTENLEQFFHPQNAAIIGVSSDLAKDNVAREIAKLLHELGHRKLYLVNPRGGSVKIQDADYPLYRSFDEIPTPIDLAVYAAPAAGAIEFINQIGERTKAVIVISGLAPHQDYAAFAAELDRVKPAGLRIIGPNCMGVFSAPRHQGKGVNTLFIKKSRLQIKTAPTSNTALFTQSGALALTALDRLQHSAVFRTIVSFGNRYDVAAADLIAYFAADPGLDLIALYLEGLAPGEGRLLFDLARKIEKPLLIYKSGRTAAGQKAAVSHTAAMSGDYNVFKAACSQAGIILAENLEDFYHYLRLFSLLAKRKPGGNRTMGVVNAGFESTAAGDGLSNLEPALLTAETAAKIRQIDRFGLIDAASPFLDVTPMADDHIFAACTEAVLQDDGVDCVFVGIVPHSNALKTTPDTCRAPGGLANLLTKLFNKYQKPMVISVNAGRYYDDFASALEEGGLPVYRSIRPAILSLDVFVRYHRSR